jgi:hypothetical protein
MHPLMLLPAVARTPCIAQLSIQYLHIKTTNFSDACSSDAACMSSPRFNPEHQSQPHNRFKYTTVKQAPAATFKHLPSMQLRIAHCSRGIEISFQTRPLVRDAASNYAGVPCDLNTQATSQCLLLQLDQHIGAAAQPTQSRSCTTAHKTRHRLLFKSHQARF